MPCSIRKSFRCGLISAFKDSIEFSLLLMVNVYNLSDLILYAACPAKYKYYKDSNVKLYYDLDDRTIVSSALKDTYIYYFQKLAFTKVGPSPVSTTKFFSKKWHEYKSMFNATGKVAGRTAPDIIKGHEAAINAQAVFDKDYEICAVNFPVEMAIDQNIYKDSVDLVLLHRPPGKYASVVIVFFDASGKPTAANDFGAILRAIFGTICVKRDLITTGIKVKCILFNALHQTSREIDQTTEHSFNYPKIITNLAKAVDLDLFYPRASNDTCNYCTWNTICSWKSL